MNKNNIFGVRLILLTVFAIGIGCAIAHRSPEPAPVSPFRAQVNKELQKQAKFEAWKIEQSKVSIQVEKQKTEAPDSFIKVIFILILAIFLTPHPISGTTLCLFLLVLYLWD